MTGLFHAHKYLGYLLVAAFAVEFAIALAVALAQAGGRPLPSLARALRVMSMATGLVLGGVVMLAGLPLWWTFNHSVTAPWIWGSIALWAPVAVVGKRVIGAEAAAVAAGGRAGARLPIGALVRLACAAAIVLLMTHKPGVAG